MIINPKLIYNKYIVSNILDAEQQIQQNWIDLTLKSISILNWKHEWNELTLQSRTHCDRAIIDFDLSNRICLQPWVYDVEFNEFVNIPNWMCANIITRSTVNRGWNFITSWLYDAGFNNYIWAILHVNIPLTIEKNVRLAQIIFSEAQEWEIYNWIYNWQMVA